MDQLIILSGGRWAFSHEDTTTSTSYNPITTGGGSVGQLCVIADFSFDDDGTNHSGGGPGDWELVVQHFFSASVARTTQIYAKILTAADNTSINFGGGGESHHLHAAFYDTNFASFETFDVVAESGSGSQSETITLVGEPGPVIGFAAGWQTNTTEQGMDMVFSPAHEMSTSMESNNVGDTGLDARSRLRALAFNTNPQNISTSVDDEHDQALFTFGIRGV